MRGRKQKNGSVGMVRSIQALLGVNLALGGTSSSTGTGRYSALVAELWYVPCLQAYAKAGDA